MEYEKKPGIVILSNRGIATVQMRHNYGCSGKHSHCPYNALLENIPPEQFLIEASNPIGAHPGQIVEVALSSKELLKVTFIIYAVPLIGLFLGYLAGWGLTHLVKMADQAEILGLVFALAGLGSFFFMVMKFGKKCNPQYTITDIIKTNLSTSSKRTKMEALDNDKSSLYLCGKCLPQSNGGRIY